MVNGYFKRTAGCGLMAILTEKGELCRLESFCGMQVVHFDLDGRNTVDRRGIDHEVSFSMK